MQITYLALSKEEGSRFKTSRLRLNSTAINCFKTSLTYLAANYNFLSGTYPETPK